MKKFIKTMLILAGILTIFGAVCIFTAFAKGLTTGDFMKMVRDGNFSFNITAFIDDWTDELGSEIGGVENEEDGTITNEVKSDCSNIKAELAACFLTVSYGDVEYIQVKQKSILDLKVSVNGDTLVIKEGSGVNIGVNKLENRRVDIILPANKEFDKVKLEIGASEAEISKIIAKELDLDVGAGKATIDELIVDKLDLDTGVGQVTISLSGTLEDYNYSVECGIGSVVVGSHSYSGIGAGEKVKNDNATKELDVDCGIGEVVIKFEK